MPDAFFPFLLQIEHFFRCILSTHIHICPQQIAYLWDFNFQMFVIRSESLSFHYVRIVDYEK